LLAQSDVPVDHMEFLAPYRLDPTRRYELGHREQLAQVLAMPRLFAPGCRTV